jgi:tetratricopeptide (TPR) repeat protein
MSAFRPADETVPTADTPPPPHGVDDLLALAISQPALALTTAHRLLADGPDDRARSLAHHAIAIVERDRGRTAEALTHARLAVRPARRAGPDREAEVRATLGTTLAFTGATTRGLAELNRALALTHGDARHRVLHLRGCTYWLLGRYDDAVGDLSRAITLSRRAGDRLWEGRALGTRGDVRRAMGDAERSAADYAAAERVHLSMGALVEATLSARNRAIVALQRGDVVEALALMDQAEERYRDAGVDPVEQRVDHAEALLAARLADEAQALINDVLARSDLAPVWRADLLLSSARAALLREEWTLAAERAREAEHIFAAHRRRRWAARSGLLALEAAFAAERGASQNPTSSRDVPVPTAGHEVESPARADDLDAIHTQAARLVARLRRLSDPSLPEALILLAQVAARTGHHRTSRQALSEAASRRSRGAPLPRAAGWLAEALLAQRQGDRRRMRHACRRGLDAVDEHRSLIGDLELRALATGYGLELVTLAASDAVSSHDARGLLWWTERWRATSLAGAAAPTPDDPTLDRDLAALRDVTRRLDEAGHDRHLERERHRLEGAVRARYRRLRSTGPASPAPDLDALVTELGDTVLVALSLVEGRLHAVTVADGRIRLRTLGDIGTILREVAHARFTLRRAAYGRDVDLTRAGEHLQAALLGPEEALDPDWSRPSVLVVPAASLLTVPFGLLPVLADSAVTLSPSTSLWRRAHIPTTAEGADRAAAGATGHVALVTGPGLSTEQREAAELRRLHPDAVVLGGADATVERVLSALDGARLAHIAAHGTFRADAPLFSTLMLADGPLMVHDLDGLSTAPRAVVLSACDSGGVHPIGADEALGLVSSLLRLGTRSAVASVDPVNDAATKEVMTHLHATAAGGGSLAEGLLAARRAATGDPVVAATAAAFNAWGA